MDKNMDAESIPLKSGPAVTYSESDLKKSKAVSSRGGSLPRLLAIVLAVGVLLCIVGVVVWLQIFLYNANTVKKDAKDNTTILHTTNDVALSGMTTHYSWSQASEPTICDDDPSTVATATGSSKQDHPQHSVVADSSWDAPENRQPHRILLRFLLDKDPLMKQLGVVGEDPLASTDKVAELLKDKVTNGWMTPDAFSPWFDALSSVLPNVVRGYYGPFSRVIVLEVTTEESMKEGVSKLRGLEDLLEFAESDTTVHHLTASGSDEDDLREQFLNIHWAVSSMGLMSVGYGQEGSTVVEGAWQYSMGSMSVVVGVADTGVDITHPDLKDNIFKNPGEIPDNSIDDDGNGYIDDVCGISTVMGAAVSDVMDDHYHGTFAAGLIGAKGTSSVDSAVGVSPYVTIMPLKVLDGSGVGMVSWVVEGLEYAMGMRVPIVAAPLGYSPSDLSGGKALEAVVAAMNREKTLLVTAAGNSRQSLEQTPVYPASYKLDNVLSVAAHTPSGCLASFSNYGPSSVDVAAPGTDILSTVPSSFHPSGYYTLSGTSASASLVAGAAALLLGYWREDGGNGTGMGLEVKELLLQNVEKDDKYKGFLTSQGRIRVDLAMQQLVSASGHSAAQKLQAEGEVDAFLLAQAGESGPKGVPIHINKGKGGGGGGAKVGKSKSGGKSKSKKKKKSKGHAVYAGAHNSTAVMLCTPASLHLLGVATFVAVALLLL